MRQLAGRGGIGLMRHVPAAEQHDLFAMLRPIATEHPLIRLGGAEDGGYLVPDDLAGIEACFSPGVDVVATFERDLNGRGIRTYQIDASVTDTPLDHPLNDFEPKFLGIETRGNLTTLDDWVTAKAPGDGDLMLQMDIEGHEWLALANVGDLTLRRFRTIVLEMHFLNLASVGLGSWLFAPVIDRLRQVFDVVHLHANNVLGLEHSRDVAMPPYLEVTMLRKDRITQRRSIDELPHQLDRNNLPDRPPVTLPRRLFAEA